MPSQYRPYLNYIVAIAVLNVLCPGKALAQPSLDDIHISGWTSSVKSEINHPITIFVRLRNTGKGTVGPIDIETAPFPAVVEPNQSLSGLVLRPQSRLDRTIKIVPSSKGQFDLHVRLRLVRQQDERTEKIASIDVSPPPTFWEMYKDVLAIFVPLGIVVVTCVVSVGIQMRVLKATRQQKTSETVLQIILNQGRDYYSPISGAFSELAESLGLMGTDESEQEHLMRRAFFFLGVILYKENEFSFSHGYIYLPHLWAEGAVRDIMNEFFELVPLSRQDEAVVHKCFSDMWRIHRGEKFDDGVTRFRMRTLYDLERILVDRSDSIPEEYKALQGAYEAVKHELAKAEVRGRLVELERSLRAILEYELTIMFREWYGTGDRQMEMPIDAPSDFDAIAGSTEKWGRVLEVVRDAREGKRETGVGVE